MIQVNPYLLGDEWMHPRVNWAMMAERAGAVNTRRVPDHSDLSWRCAMAKAHPMLTDLTAEYVRSILDYDPETGIFRWKERTDVSPRVNKRVAGREAGSVTTSSRRSSYRLIGINGRLYVSHRLAWLYVHGEWPSGEVDHKNGDGLDNRIANLRVATRSQNARNRGPQRNNKTGFKGVSWNSARQCYVAQIQYGGKLKNLGDFDSAEEAHAAYEAAACEHHGEFARSDWERHP